MSDIPDAIVNRHGERLDFAFEPSSDGRRELCVIGHGVTANKDRPFLQTLAECLKPTGLASLRVSFAGNGDSGGRFEEATITKEVEDLTCVLDALEGWRISYAGHSMGGAVGVLAAARDARIERLISLAGMVHTADFARRKFCALKPGRDCMWEKPDCPLSQTFVDDMQRIGSVLPQALELDVPWLLVHGTDDTVVPLQDSIDAQAAARAPAELVRLDGCDHVFSDGADERMAEAVARWVTAAR